MERTLYARRFVSHVELLSSEFPALRAMSLIHLLDDIAKREAEYEGQEIKWDSVVTFAIAGDRETEFRRIYQTKEARRDQGNRDMVERATFECPAQERKAHASDSGLSGLLAG